MSPLYPFLNQFGFQSGAAGLEALRALTTDLAEGVRRAAG